MNIQFKPIYKQAVYLFYIYDVNILKINTTKIDWKNNNSNYFLNYLCNQNFDVCFKNYFLMFFIGNQQSLCQIFQKYFFQYLKHFKILLHKTLNYKQFQTNFLFAKKQLILIGNYSKMQMEEEQNSDITCDIDAQILEELQNKKKLIDRQLQILCDLENQTKEELSIWEEKCKNLRQIYNYYNYSQAQYPRNLIQKEPHQNSKCIQADIQIKSQQIDQIQQMPQLQQKPLQSQAVNKFEMNQNQENNAQSQLIDNKQNADQFMQKKLIPQSPIQQQNEVQNKKVVLKNVELEDEEFEDDFEEQKEDSNKNEFKLLKTPQIDHQKKTVSPTQNLIQELNNVRVEKKIKNQAKKFKFPKDQIIAPSPQNDKPNIERKDDVQQQQKLDNFKTFEKYMQKYINKFQDESPNSILKQLQKAKKIKAILGVPDEKLIISHKWLKQFKAQINKFYQ
ncbi:hypothetical protein TTHERM_00540180 (macronuclear) [Tetrahymena thermophila SB210]|uniref:Uncharacterized protein n=1 Tax=Tetrahymena thermophila (strain SB210) TaxID=312017 RepID=I7M720_TETTS|nr:hypothetical protein TTHERM_00540180 [Tetrahymena thermophila SB210]EAR87698.4 hypothetical protein TTHERM_00540180 [Tetrahymena thermophila SB210]|eukprot:XP_001007943.4 hypothetical protein TTHERM_00540180 [Tetrahymena thermophila SB210]